MNGRGSLVESGEARGEQYSLAKILGIWALAAAPMGILGWIAFPLLAPDFESAPLGSGVTRVVLLTLGLVWLFVLSMIIVRREEGDLRWATIKRGSGSIPRGTQRPENPAQGSGCGWCLSLLLWWSLKVY